MYKTINGWTKQQMKEQIRLKNNGTQSKSDNGCVYRTEDGNSCAAGCFISDKDIEFVKYQTSTVFGLPEFIVRKFPLPLMAMRQFQQAHDGGHYYNMDMRDILCNWIDTNVEE